MTNAFSSSTILKPVLLDTRSATVVSFSQTQRHERIKSMKNRITAALLAVMFVLTLVPQPATAADSMPFSDVPEDAYYRDAVEWACEEGITKGTSETKFSPESVCTRGQVVTFLWREAGKPLPETDENPFEDVGTGDYYYYPVLWAVENGITTGTSSKRFSPDVTCSNAHILTFIWRAMGRPDETGEGSWYGDAVRWASGCGLTEGTYSGGFDPAGGCPRANVVTYLYRYSFSGILTLYVSAGAAASVADGTAERPFATIEEARDCIRDLDRSGLRGIIVDIAEGSYDIKETISFTEEDSGTESCPITYKGSGKVILSGGISLASSDFTKASGDTAAYFPSDGSGSIVMADLKGYGVTPEYVRELFSQDNITYSSLIQLYKDGQLQTLSRWPNDTYAAILDGDQRLYDENGKTGQKYRTYIKVDQETEARILGWHDLATVFSKAMFSALWRPNNYRLISYDTGTGELVLPYPGAWFSMTYCPQKGMPIFFINIPEELDAPGEYYIDEDAVLYYYMDDTFASSMFSIPSVRTCIDIRSAEHLTFSGLVIEGFSGTAVKAEGGWLTFDSCEIRASDTGAEISGDHNTFRGSVVHDIQFDGVVMMGGDRDTLTRSGSAIYNCEFYEWGQVVPYYNPAVTIKGCGVTLSHNYIHDGDHEAVTWDGNFQVIEYNEICNVCRKTDDAGAVYAYNGYDGYGTVIRYNYVHDISLQDGFLSNIDGYTYCGVSGIYIDGGRSGHDIYGNILEGITGAGVASGGRDIHINNNLFISCGWSATMSAVYYTQRMSGNTDAGGGKDNQKFAGREDNEYWKEAFPVLYMLDWDLETGDTEDPYFFISPAGNELKDNYFFYDKSNTKSMKWYGHLFTNDISQYTLKFSGDSITDAEEGVNQTTYSSMRTKIYVKEAIGTAEPVTGITLGLMDLVGMFD